MREIKFEYGFQSVNGIIKKVYALSEIPNIKDKCDVWDILPIVYVRQFTGIKDKNGTDIYEGDFVKRINTENVDGFFGIVKYERLEFRADDLINQDNWDSVLDYQEEVIEVTGNIHEVPNI